MRQVGSPWREVGYRQCLIVFAMLVVASPSSAAGADTPPWLRVDLSLYPYLDRVDNDVDLTGTINADLPGKFSYFSFSNYRGVVSAGDFDFHRTEQNLRWRIADNVPLDLTLQAIIFGGDHNDDWQVGISWRMHDTPFLEDFFDRINLFYRLTFHIHQVSSPDDQFWQMEHYFMMLFPGISERLYLSGFLDQSFGLRDSPVVPEDPIVTEIQLGMRLFDKFYAIAEYRINEKRVSEIHNFAAGIEYKFRW